MPSRHFAVTPDDWHKRRMLHLRFHLNRRARGTTRVSAFHANDVTIYQASHRDKRHLREAQQSVGNAG